MADIPLVSRAARLRLGVEFAVIFVAAPLVMALALPPTRLFPALFAVTGGGLVLLHLTSGFLWRDLTRGWGAVRWGAVAGMAGVTLVTCLAVLMHKEPQALFMPGRADPGLLVMVLLLYPLLSALPQEILFRALYFRRYGGLLPRGREGIVLNAALFALAHLMYWNVVVALMTFFGGLAFAWAYEERRSFATAVVMHAVAGQIVFAVGMGVYFYSGNVVRPF